MSRSCRHILEAAQTKARSRRGTVPSRAQLAQLVEHFHGKEGVSGSSPLLGFSRSAAACASLRPALAFRPPVAIAPESCLAVSGAPDPSVAPLVS
jgi:hypothetical protein